MAARRKTSAPKKRNAPAGKSAQRKRGASIAKKPKIGTKHTKARAKPKAPRRKPQLTKQALVPNPEALALARTIAGIALDKKATEVLIIDTRGRASLVGYDYLVLATAESDRQLGAIEEGLNDVLKPQGTRPTTVESSPDWVAADYSDVVVHFLTPEKRALYDLEGLWSDAPRVALNLA